MVVFVEIHMEIMLPLALSIGRVNLIGILDSTLWATICAPACGLRSAMLIIKTFFNILNFFFFVKLLINLKRIK